MSYKISRPLAKSSPVAIASCPRAIVRSHFDELSVLRVVRREGALIVVASEDGAHMVAVPESYVFGFSEKGVSRLKQALSGGDAKLIASTWETLENYED